MALDRFVCGLHPVLCKDVLLCDPHTYEEAMTATERIGAIHNYVTGRHSFVPRLNHGQNHGGTAGSGTGYAPMDLDMLHANNSEASPNNNRSHYQNQ